ncbi:hypothetical protein E4U54_000764, partial [Claviceps lovelessii]
PMGRNRHQIPRPSHQPRKRAGWAPFQAQASREANRLRAKMTRRDFTTQGASVRWARTFRQRRVRRCPT